MHLEYGLSNKIGHILSAAALTEITDVNSGTHIKKIKRLPKVRLAPYKQDANSCCKVFWQYRIKMSESYSDVTSFAAATTGAELRVDRKPPQLDFTSDSDADVEHIPQSNTWYFKRSFIPGQHVRVRWFPHP